jgi:hypothetical protein
MLVRCLTFLARFLVALRVQRERTLQQVTGKLVPQLLAQILHLAAMPDRVSVQWDMKVQLLISAVLPQVASLAKPDFGLLVDLPYYALQFLAQLQLSMAQQGHVNALQGMEAQLFMPAVLPQIAPLAIPDSGLLADLRYNAL